MGLLGREHWTLFVTASKTTRRLQYHGCHWAERAVDAVTQQRGGVLVVGTVILQPGNTRRRSRVDADVVVIGAGPAGLAVATALATTDQRVVVLESGGLDPRPDRDAGRARVHGRLAYFDMSECRPRGLGGSSVLWGGWCEPLGELDFDSPRGVAETGWCISRPELEPWYRRARSFCGIPEVTSSRAWRRAAEEAVRAGPFHLCSFPVLGPSQLGRRHVDRFCSDNVDLLLDATVTRIAMTGDGATVDHVVVAAPDGEKIVTGDVFVLAAGGIETPRLLLSSAVPAWPDGVGNAYDVVGRCFMEHPHIDAMRLRGDRELLDVEYFLERQAGETLDGEPLAAAGALVLDDDVCRGERIGRVQLFVEPAGGHTQHPLSRWRAGRPERLRLRPPGDEDLAVIAVSEQVPNRQSRVTLSDTVDRHGLPLPAVYWELTDSDHHTALVGVEAARNLLLSLGAQHVRRRLRRTSWPSDTLGACHHLGTARMAHSPRNGVVDGDCRVHGARNLFVAGGAVFPTSGYAPPTLTIVALALRLADHLAYHWPR